MMQRLLVVDDDEAVTSSLRRGFAYEGYEVEVARTGEEALSKARETPPDIVVLDITMPGIDGFEVCRRLREGDEQPAILMLTARDAPLDQVKGLDLGADDYVTKPFNFDVLAARVRAILRHRETQGRVLEYGGLRLDTGERTAFRDESRIELTATEFELLAYLLANARIVLSKGQIMEHVWGYDFGGNANIVEVYIRTLRQKLEGGGAPRLIQTVRGAGYALREA
ncbi:MAG: response regulator transcription factor [Dehalococcoidia bacterium]